MFLVKILFALAILASTLGAGWFPFRKRQLSNNRHDFPAFQAFASGIFLGVGLIHMLSDANSEFLSSGYNAYPMAFFLAGVVFLILLFLEHLGREVSHHHGNYISPVWVFIAVSILSIHSFLAGIALGMSKEYTTAIMIFVAIIAHKWAAGFALAVQINNSNLSKRARICYYLFFCMMTPIGLLFGTSLNHFFSSTQMPQAIFMSLAAGTFLYIGTLHGLSQAIMINRCCNNKEYLLVILGFIIMAGLAIVS